MIIQEKNIKVYEGNSCYCKTDREAYNFYNLEMSSDYAWEIVQSLLTVLRNGGNIIELSIYEEI